MTLIENHSYNSNMRCHDLCAKIPPPNNMAMLLVLGSKFCVQTKKLDKKAFNVMINRFKNDVRFK